MFAPDSRYATLPTATHTAPDGREIVYVTRRFLPRTADLSVVAKAAVGEGDRLDQLSARALGDPGRYWAVCDANEAMHPPDLVRQAGTHLLIATTP